MGNKTESAVAKLEEIGGSIKQATGQLIGNRRLEVNGRADQLNAKAEQERLQNRQRIRDVAEGIVDSVQDAAVRAEGAVVQAVGNVQEAVGDMLNNTTLEATGKANAKSGLKRRRGATPTAAELKPTAAAAKSKGW